MQPSSHTPSASTELAALRARVAELEAAIAETSAREDANRTNSLRLEAMLALHQCDAAGTQELLDFALEQALRITSSEVGYVYFYDETTQVFTLNSWSAAAMDQCRLADKQRVYPLASTGIWGEAVRRRRAILVNDFAKPHPLKCGLPKGHVTLRNFLTIPVFVADKIVAVVGVGNRPGGYAADEVKQLELFMQGVWNLAGQKQADERPGSNQMRFKLLADNVRDMLWTIDPRGKFTYVSPSALRLLGYMPGDLEGSSFELLLPPCSLEAAREKLRWFRKAATTAGGAQPRSVFELEQVRKDCSRLWTEITASPLIGPDKAFLGVAGVTRDISTRKRTEEALRQSEQRLRIIADNTFDWEYWRAPEGGYLWVSPACERISGYPPEDFTEKNLFIRDIAHPDDVNLWVDHVRDIDNHCPPHREMDMRIVRKNGETVWISHTCTPIYGLDGTYLGRRGCNRDVTERRLAQEAVNRSLAEKTVLLKEVHHRVKNNLQILMSLMSLQMENMADTRDTEAFLAMQNRVRSIALVHERLYRSPDLSAVNMKTYLEELVAKIASTYSGLKNMVCAVVDAAPLSLAVDQAIPLGLLVTELVTNAFKHAFLPTVPGRLEVTLKTQGGNCILSVEDDGPGLPCHFTLDGAGSLGLQLVKALESQLCGMVGFREGKGARFEVVFPLV